MIGKITRVAGFVFGCMLVFACKKNTERIIEQPPTDVTIIPAVDPPVANTMDFFLADWQPKSFTAPAYINGDVPSSATLNVTVDASSVITKIPASIFGNNANIWMSQLVTEPSLMTDIKNLHPHIIRFPGGSISDIFFWNAPKGVNHPNAPDLLLSADAKQQPAGYWYGKNAESWTLSLDNYYNMLQQTGNTGMIIVNYGFARYGTGPNPVADAAHLAADWVRYDNGRTKYWEVGNENYGNWEAGYRIDISNNKDGQPEFITGDIYGQHFKVFSDSMKKAAQEIGKTIYIGAVMKESAPESWNTLTEKSWNTGLLSKAANSPDFLIVHNYYTPYQQNSNADLILNSAILETKKMMDYVKYTIQAAAVTQKPVALTEWNIFAEGSMQQVSHINGMHAVLLLGEVLENKIGMAARWDLANGWSNGNDHGMFNIGDEPGATRWSPRPAFYHMYFFKKFLGDRFIPSSVANDNTVESYASSFSSGEVGVTLVNKSTSAKNAQIAVKNFNAGTRFYWYTLTGGDDNGEFSRKVFVNGAGPAGVSGGPGAYTDIKAYSALSKNGLRVTLPARSVVHIVIDKK